MIIDDYRSIVRKYIIAAIEMVEQQWDSYPDEYGAARMYYTKKAQTENMIAYVLSAAGQKMWVLEYGKGEFMADESQNPFLADYLSSGYYNTARNKQGRKVLGRPKGNYLDLDNVTHYSNGHLEGVPLEEVGLGKFIDNQIGWPIKPKFIIRNILFGENGTGLLSEMQQELQMATAKYVLKTLKHSLPRRIVIMK